MYTACQTWGNKLLVRGVEDGQRFLTKVPFEPTLFVRSKTPNKTGWKSLHGEALDPIHFDTMKEAKEFLKKYEGVANYPIFGNSGFQYQYITENYPAKIEYDLSQIEVAYIDIETECEYGFPDIYNPIEELLLISVKEGGSGKITTFGTRPFDTSKIKHIRSPENFSYVECKNEEELIEKFLDFWREYSPDIVTSWNGEYFDIPYLMTRITRVAGEDKANQLSPWDIVNEKIVRDMGRERLTYNIYGIAALDYLALYKKFVVDRRESYKLDFIAQYELKHTKLKNPHPTMKEFYTNDWQLFVEYNVVDVELIAGLEEKMRLIELVISVAYIAHCNFQDVFSPGRTWDALIYNYLYHRHETFQHRDHSGEDGQQIAGGYVHIPEPGRYRWVVSFDAASLYPSIIIDHNLSPETMDEGIIVDAPLRRTDDRVYMPELLNEQVDVSVLAENDRTMTANGICYHRDKVGMIPTVISGVLAERKIAKNGMLELQKRIQEIDRRLESRGVKPIGKT